MDGKERRGGRHITLDVLLASLECLAWMWSRNSGGLPINKAGSWIDAGLPGFGALAAFWSAPVRCVSASVGVAAMKLKTTTLMKTNRVTALDEFILFTEKTPLS